MHTVFALQSNGFEFEIINIWRPAERHKSKGHESAWMDSALTAVGVHQRHSFLLDELPARNVTLELDALTNSDMTFRRRSNFFIDFITNV